MKILSFSLSLSSAFNMLTMQKEKVNTHFSFPMKLDMSGYVEKSLLPQQYQESKSESSDENKQNDDGNTDEPCEKDKETEIEKMDVCTTEETVNETYEYSLIGVTVHTGNADGGHYYSFIKERNGPHPHAPDRWFLFNDAEVKQFDPSQIEAECFGGEMTSKTYDTVTEKYLDFSFEKTNSAYMLFYERISPHQSHFETHSDQGSLDENIKIDESYEQASCSTAVAATTPSPPAMPQSASVNKINDFNRTQNETSENSANLVEKSDETMTIDPSTDSVNDDSTADHKKCDIDTKSGSDCNENANDKTAIDAANKTVAVPSTSSTKKTTSPSRHLLNKELEEWIWEDNRYFLQDRNIFEHTYFK